MKKSEVWYPYLNFAVCPKCFFTDRKFTALSSNARLLYIFLFDRTRLSAKNGLCDTDDEVFVFCTVETACEILNCSHNTAIKTFKEIESAQLLHRARTGVMRTYKIYLTNPYDF